MRRLRGRPVLIEFWDFCRPNSIRTLPYVKAWQERYGPAGLTVIGVHSPGFAPSADADAVRAAVRPLVSGYLTVPVYRAYQAWLGHAEVLAAMWDAWDAGDRKAATAAVPDEVVDSVCVHGPPGQCREQIAAYVGSGVTTPVLALLPSSHDPSDYDPRDAIRRLAP
jgi:hypothetical protein